MERERNAAVTFRTWLAMPVLGLGLAAPLSARALPEGPTQGQIPPTGNDALPTALQDVGVDEKLGGRVPLDALFADLDGSPVHLGALLGKGRPVVLSLVYLNCPMLCGLVLDDEARSMRASGLELGKDFDAVTISFDPADTPKLAAERQRNYVQAFEKPEQRRAWTFLTGEATESRRVADALGFRYAYDARTKQFAHPAVIFVLKPDGGISRYLYGIAYDPKDLRLALVEAGQGRVGTSADRLLLTCYRYDPASRKYVPFALGFLRLGLLGVLSGLAVMLGVFWRRELKRRDPLKGRTGPRPGGGPGR